ncbi:cob(I)yrinic acid a,c-diamide adenosyltransferase [Candidatus Microgenomates bacterium]|nr:cob(I)yrinic acid a,c-diamide adenosyltransferase [Candidatus Microgenomates bacterium]
MKIYTKTGDDGTTGILGKRLSKSDPIIETLGSIDELNAYLGVINLPELEKVQRDLMQINSFLAGFKINIPNEKGLEKQIDKMEKELPELKNFILPRGQIHYARTICRRAERNLVKIKPACLPARQVTQVHSNAIKYLNRLSDYLFVLARWVNHKKGAIDKPWRQ